MMPGPFEAIIVLLFLGALLKVLTAMCKNARLYWKRKNAKQTYESDGNYEGCGIDTQRAMEQAQKNRAADLATAAKILHFARLSAFDTLRGELNGDLRHNFEKWMRMRSITALECKKDDWSGYFIYTEPMVQMAWEGWLAHRVWEVSDPLNARLHQPSI